MRPKGGTRCPKDCPQRAPGCHNIQTCACWKKQMEEDAARHAAIQARRGTGRLSWESRGIKV